VLIADDHSVVREGLASLIRRKPDMTVVGEASNGREAVDLWKQCRPDVTLLDLRMPELDGVSAIKEIRAGLNGAVDIIRRVHAGETCLPVHLAAKLAERVSGETLSAREIEVLKLMAQGKSNKEIGSALFISEGTVKSHVKAIFAKMNVISRTEAVANATRRGLIQL
jgi:two-component system NarL family response regulator